MRLSFIAEAVYATASKAARESCASISALRSLSAGSMDRAFNHSGRHFAMKGSMMDYPLTLQAILERIPKTYPAVEIVSRLPDGSLYRYTYLDFYRRAKSLAEALHRAGLQPGDRVGTLCWNHYAHLEAYFGVPAAGGVVHTLNLRLHPEELAFIVNHAQDRFLIVDDVLLPL